MKKLITITLVFLLCFTLSCQQQGDGRSKDKRTVKATSDENAELVVRFFHEIDKKNFDLVMSEILSPDYQDHMPGSKKSKSWEELRETIDMWHQGFPDLTHTIHDVFSKGNMVAARGTTCGTHKGEFSGFKSTGKEICLTFICIFQVEDGKLTDRWPQFDYHGWLEQLRANADEEVAEKPV